LLKEKIQHRPQDDDGCKLPDLGPSWGNSSSQNVGRDLKLQCKNEPPTESQPNVFYDRFHGTSVEKQDERPDGRLNGRKPDENRRA
jgi:hypothetical protein